MDLYHKEIGFPAWFSKPTGSIRPNYGNHSKIAAFTDRYGTINLPPVIDWSKFEVIEISAIENQVQKILVRGSLDQFKDICIVIVPRTGFVKTVWVNMKADTHRTLDKSKYKSPS